MNLKPLTFGTGIECSRAQCQPLIPFDADELSATGHHQQFREDFDLIAATGVRDVRIPVMWPWIQKKRDLPQSQWDWSWQDEYVQAAVERGLHVTLDTIHHTNGPDDVPLDDPSMPERATEFVVAALDRYPEAQIINIQNEPFTNALFCGMFGKWHPFKTGDANFVKACVTIARTICTVSQALARHPVHNRVHQYHNDPCEAHQLAPKPYPLAPETEGFTWLKNQQRFLMLDMVLGMIDDDHPLIPFLRKNGFTEEDQAWFQSNPARIDMLGLDYYDRHEHSYHATGDLSWHSDNRPRGLADIVFNDYWPRYKDHVKEFLVGETNLYASDPEKWTWFLYCWSECEYMRQQGCPIQRLDWQGFFGGRHWMHELTQASDKFCDFGVATVRQNRSQPWKLDRKTGMFYELFSLAAKGGIDPHAMVAFPFEGVMKERMKGFVEGPMRKYDWICQESSVQRAA